jgi:hemolysin activation/secretion protein
MKSYPNHMDSGSINALRFHSAEAGATYGSRFSRRLLPCLSFGFCFLIAGGSVQAQQVPPSGYDPRQTEKRFEDQSQAPAGRPRLPKPQFERNEKLGDNKPLFLLRHVSVTGAVAIPPARLAMAYQPYLGKKVSQADLTAMAAVVGDIYREAGFDLTRAIVPPQDIQNGRLQLQVIEGRITEVALTGDGAERFGARPLLEVVLSERPSRRSTIERQLLLINSLPGVRIDDTDLEEIGAGSGHFRLGVSLKTWHIFTSVGGDNLGSSSVGPWQSYSTAAFNSYLAPGDSLVVNLSTTPGDPRQLAFGRLSYDAPVGTDGARIGASGFYSEVRPGDIRRLFNDTIKTDWFEVRGSLVPVQSQKSSLILTAAAGFSNVYENDIFGPIYADHIRTASLTSDYRLQDSFGGTNYLTVNYRQGLDIFGASRNDDFYTSHDGASPNFSVLNFWFTRYQTLSDAWSIKLATAGQTASGPLFTSQQFYLGGLAFGRGYGSAEISGDNGVAGTLEVRFDQKTSFQYLGGYQVYAFVDTGVAWNDGYRPSDGLALTSAGAGVRFFLTDSLQADIGLAVPLTYRAPDNPGGGALVLFSLSSALKLCPARPQSRCL